MTFSMRTKALASDAPTGRVGEVIRRGGRGRYWEIVLADTESEPVSKYVDGLEPAFDAVSGWLQGECSLGSTGNGQYRFLMSVPFMTSVA